MSMFRYILSVFSTNYPVVLSWGLHDYKAKGEYGVSFKVQGFLHTGKVEVSLNALDLFDVKLINPDGSEKETVNNIYVDNLVDVIDAKVEKCENYAEKVSEVYSI